MTRLETALTTWEAVYTDGSILREADGLRYADIPRDDLDTFRLVHRGELIFATPSPAGATGANLRYRIRSETGPGGLIQMFVLGWEPHGPAFLLDPVSLDTDRLGLWVADQGFHTQAECRCEVSHPQGWFDPPAPIGGER